MSKDVDFNHLEKSTGSDAQKNVLSLIKQTLQGEDDSALKPITIADGLRGLAESNSSGEEVEGFLWNLWMVLVDIVSLIPVDHPWQDVVEGALKNLQETGGNIWSKEEQDPFLWSDLPYLPQYMLDIWADPTERKGWKPQDIDVWKNLNSFAARLSTAEFHPWLHFSKWQLKSAFDEDAPKGTGLDCRVWVATEWILRCGELIFRLEGVNLRDSVSQEGLQQLKGWRDKLLELEKNSQSSGLTSSTVDRIPDTVKILCDIEAKVRQG